METAMDVDDYHNPALEMFNRHPVYDNIFSCLTPLSLTRMASVNRAIRTVTKDFTARAYNINRRLSNFVSEPLTFRSLMARTHMVISGSFALQFFDRTYYPDSDLDLYLHPDRNILDVGRYLVADGYQYKPMSWQLVGFKEEAERICANIDIEIDEIENDDEANLLYSLRSLRAVYTFEKELGDGTTRKVQLIVSRISPLASILDFHSTCVMNIISYNAAYSLYPYATFERREALVVNKESQSQDALAKYSSRGWRILANPSPLNEFLEPSKKGNPLYNPWFFVRTPRWVCDGRSWTIPLDVDGVVPPPLPSPSSQDPGWDPVAECGWLLSMSKPPEPQVGLCYETIKSTIFRWQYTSPNLDYIRNMYTFLRSQGKMEHLKIPSGKTREDVADAWTWWDHVLPMLRESFLVAYPSGSFPTPTRRRLLPGAH